MYDIEVIDGHNYAVISDGSPAYEFLKAMNSKLVMKKLASEPGEAIFLAPSEMAVLNRRFKKADYARLMHVDLIAYDCKPHWDPVTGIMSQPERYSFTEFGLEIMRDLKANGGDIEICLN